MIGMAEKLSDRFDFRVVAEGVPGDRMGEWRHVAGLPQQALPRGRLGARGLLALLRRERSDLLLLNGFFDRQLTIPALSFRRMRLFQKVPVLLAPRGEFSGGALALKAGRKRAYLRLVRRAGLLEDVSLLATSPSERDLIEGAMGSQQRVLLGPNIRPVPPLPIHRVAEAGEGLRLAFLGRIVPMKNLDFALARLGELDERVTLNLYGPVEDRNYWGRCEALIRRLPTNISVRQCGLVPQQRVLEELAANDLLFLPSRGENFGHAIFEALAAGTPVLISDRTPWRNLVADNSGWDLPLEAPEQFTSALKEAARLSPDAWRVKRQAARAVAERALGGSAATEQLSACLSEAMCEPVGPIGSAEFQEP
jgi:glycosyltransferase involved in cell wall biosynthesis